MIDMGVFSWITSDTKKSIRVDEEKSVYVLIPEEFGGGYIQEDFYEGYGMFGGRDIYELVAIWNGTERQLKPFRDNDGSITSATNEWGERVSKDGKSLRNLGINIFFANDPNGDGHGVKFPIKIVENSDLTYEEVEASKSCPEQGYF